MKFKNVSVGEIFKFNKTVYVKIIQRYRHNSISLFSGEFVKFYDEDVEVINEENEEGNVLMTYSIYDEPHPQIRDEFLAPFKNR